MTRLEELINELCPDGVEYRNLSQVTQYSKARVCSAELHSENYVGVDNLLPNKRGKSISIYVPDSGMSTYFEKNNILIGNIRPYLKKIWQATHFGGTNGDVLVIQINDYPKLSPDFLFYILSSDVFFDYNMQHAKGSKMPRGDKAAIMQYSIPLPRSPFKKRLCASWTLSPS